MCRNMEERERERNYIYYKWKTRGIGLPKLTAVQVIPLQTPNYKHDAVEW